MATIKKKGTSKMKKDTAKRPRINESEAVIGAVGMTTEELKQ